MCDKRATAAPVVAPQTACAAIIRALAPRCEIFSIRVLGPRLTGKGIVFAEGLTPTRIEVDKFGHASAVTFQDGIQLPARSVLIAAGTQPNTVLAREEGVSLALDGKYFQACDENGVPVKPERNAANIDQLLAWLAEILRCRVANFQRDFCHTAKRQIDRVREDENVKAIVLRVDSPGGTVTGSDYLYHHLSKLREERGIPLEDCGD